MKKTVLSVFSKILTAAFVMILIAVLLINLSTRLTINKINNGGFVKTGYSCVIVVSGSMEPAIDVGDLLIVKGAESYNYGDVVTYLSENGSLITHRVEALSKDGYITHGDANNVSDGEIPAQRLLGKTAVILPGMGMAIRWFFSPVSIAFSACIVLLLWLIVRLNLARKNQTFHG